MHPLMISPLGEPGSGKSTFSLGLCHALKRVGIHAEFVPEVIKHEVFTPEGVARVVSGRYDSRYLRLQHAATQGFLRQAEVIVNDGALEPFYFYGKGRVPAHRFPAYEALLERFRQEQALAEHRFVALELNLDYQGGGRHQDDVTARAMRAPLLDALKARYGIVPTVLSGQAAVDAFTAAVVDEALARRSVRAGVETGRVGPRPLRP